MKKRILVIIKVNICPLQSGGVLDASTIYCVWAVKFFWEGDSRKPPENMVSICGWLRVMDTLMYVYPLYDFISLPCLNCHKITY